MRLFTCKDFCKISSDQSNITSDGRHLSSDGPSYVANLSGNFALARYPLRHIHVLPKDELLEKFSSQWQSSACYTESGRYINIRTPVYPIYSSLNMWPVCDQSSDLLSCVQSCTTRLLCKEQLKSNACTKQPAHTCKSHDTNHRNRCYMASYVNNN